MCEQQYFLEYVLGIRSPSNKKADKGTIVHKVLEILAIMKHAQQDGKESIEDDVVGRISDMNQMFDDNFVLDIVNKVYDYYTSQFQHHEWKDIDRRDCTKWVSKALLYNDRMFDPRYRDIVQPEQHFDIAIDKPWAKYSYDTPEGKLEGVLAIKGTIDLITRVNENTFEVIDWKTGRRLDWATGQEKTQEKLETDAQLRIYHYAISKLYSDIQNIIVSIDFINDGGAFSLCYEPSDLVETEYMIKRKFEYIKATKKPLLSKSWKCTKLCHFGKTTFEDTHAKPIIEYRDGQICNPGDNMTKCEQIKHDIDLMGIDDVVKNYTVPGYSVGKYKAPGEI